MADSVKHVVAVVGPTASGKTKLAVEIAKRLDGEIVSFDSMQIYKGMDIASAKPSADQLQEVRHHLISFLDAQTPYSVADFCKDAKRAVDDILSRGKLPVMAGGTGLYVDSFLNSVSFSDEHADSELREQLKRKTNEQLMSQLTEIDPVYAAKLNLRDTKRIIRALEVYIKTGNTMTQTLIDSRAVPSEYTPIYIGINFEDREKLYDRIDLRVDQMMEAGLIDEARTAYENRSGTTSSQAIGHKELFPYFDGEESLESCVERLKQSTRRYAKRQLSWFRRNRDIHWLFADNMSSDELIRSAIDIIEQARKGD